MSTEDMTRAGSEAKTVAVTGEAALHRSKAELRADAMTARAELARTLDAIEYKLNLPKQFRYRVRLLRLRLNRLGEDNPAALAGIALAAALVTGAAVWLGVKAVQDR
ncbi:DUF3618 domain-containing protein [Cryobacterium algoritolerans]|nr:DUF3618 domain-containing protein [Cryobacterium algoritolerans]